jgi:hypothetical protein
LRSLSSSTIYHSVPEYNQFTISYIRKHLLMCQNTGKHDWIEMETKANDPDSSARQTEHACFLRIFTSVVKHISLLTTFICLWCMQFIQEQLYLIQSLNTIGIFVQ